MFLPHGATFSAPERPGQPSLCEVGGCPTSCCLWCRTHSPRDDVGMFPVVRTSSILLRCPQACPLPFFSQQPTLLQPCFCSGPCMSSKGHGGGGVGMDRDLCRRLRRLDPACGHDFASYQDRSSAQLGCGGGRWKPDAGRQGWEGAVLQAGH